MPNHFPIPVPRPAGRKTHKLLPALRAGDPPENTCACPDSGEDPGKAKGRKQEPGWFPAAAKAETEGYS